MAATTQGRLLVWTFLQAPKQTDRQTQTHTDTKTQRRTHKCTHRWAQKWTHKCRDRWTHRCGHSRCSWQLIKSDHFMAGSALHRLLQKKTEVFLSYRAGCTDSLAQWLTARSTKLVVGGSIPRARGFEFGERHGGGTAGRRRDRGGGMGCGGSLNGRRQEKPASW